MTYPFFYVILSTFVTDLKLCLFSSMIHFYLDDSTQKWKADPVIQVDPIELNGWALPSCPGLITDFLLSMDDK